MAGHGWHMVSRNKINRIKCSCREGFNITFEGDWESDWKGDKTKPTYEV